MRLVEVTHACRDEALPTKAIESALDVSHRRARETILEAARIDLLDEHGPADETDAAVYQTTTVGENFLDAVMQEDWEQASDILEKRSPHYGAFLETLDGLEDTATGTLDVLLNELEKGAEFTPYAYNQTSIEVIGDWAERLGAIQRNAFTGTYYPVETHTVPSNFPWVLLSVFDELEETTGVGMRQRYLSIPLLREHTCERLALPRSVFDEALVDLASENVGKLELSGAPVDTGAKDARLGVKTIRLADEDGLVSTDQSTDQVMRGVEQYGKRYYYLAVHDRDLTFSTEKSV
nr:hypothetical protein [Haloarchaeobius amylolyticus]